MTHIRKRFSLDQVKVLLSAYLKGRVLRKEIQEELGIGKTRFFFLLKQYRKDPQVFTLIYRRHTPPKLNSEVSLAIQDGLLFEKKLIEDPTLPIFSYNYSALRDRLLEKQGIKVSVTTIIKKAKELSCYQPKRKAKSHERQVLTTAIGALIQHDTSFHRWSPYIKENWGLITSLDDFSRKLLYADLVEHETTWTHIAAVEQLTKINGLPLRYYVDQLRIFRFIQGRDSIWRKHVLQTDDVDPQWKQMMRAVGIDVIYALSPQAKGKIERPYRWLQDRIVRTCAIEHIARIEDVRKVLQHEVDRYNNRQVHSTTGEIPALRFENAQKEGNTLFRSLTIPYPYQSTKDLFCLREKRMVNGYRKISLFTKEIIVPKVPLREYVDILMIPDKQRGVVELRFWWKDQIVHTITYPIRDFPTVHF